MDFNALLNLIGNDPVFESSLLLAGDINPKIVRLQLSRWVNSGRIYQLRRGLYAVAPPYQKVKPHPFLIANHLQRASYVSLQTALAYYDLIPEVVNITVSITAGRPERLVTPLGIFEFRHVKPQLFSGYQMVDFGGQSAFLATAEKALLDLIYLQPGGENENYLHEIRLQNLNQLDPDLLKKQADNFDSPKIYTAVKVILDMIQSSIDRYEDL